MVWEAEAGNILWGDSFDPEDTEGGIGGDGGNVFITELTAIANQQYDYACGTAGKGGAGGETHGSRGDDGEPGTPGTDTTFGVYTSANGKPYPIGIMDIQSGAVYAQKGPDYGGTITALEGSGGAGGEQGETASMHSGPLRMAIQKLILHPTPKTVLQDRTGNLDASLWSGEKMGVI